MLTTTFHVCPNSECRKFTLWATLYESSFDIVRGREEVIETLQSWRLMPASSRRNFPDYIPEAIRADYGEACAIKGLSPKASATLARRCLQGMLRDYWKVKPGRLVNEINQIQEKVDPLAWAAIEAVRKLGNIGAHMEKDIDVIVDVDPNEAELLIGLIERLLEDWYITREKRRTSMTALIDAAAAKTGQ
ncbi:MAG: DUF4145 domain-containing protein [Alphaproteobacteria bacterium]|jgi:hypothetical protein